MLQRLGYSVPVLAKAVKFGVLLHQRILDAVQLIVQTIMLDRPSGLAYDPLEGWTR
jgi:hypothetical protein